MRLKILTSSIVLALCFACSTNNSPIKSQTVEFVQSSGKIEVEFKGGEWNKIQASGTAAILVDHNSDIEQAMNVATLRAKASLVEFLNENVKSSRSTRNVTTATNGDEKSAIIDSQAMESIISEASHILKGVVITERKVSENKDYVMVKIMADRKYVNASKNISKTF